MLKYTRALQKNFAGRLKREGYKMLNLKIVNGRIIDAENKRIIEGDIGIKDGVITFIGNITFGAPENLRSQKSWQEPFILRFTPGFCYFSACSNSYFIFSYSPVFCITSAAVRTSAAMVFFICCFA